jgi:hypothetical protein
MMYRNHRRLPSLCLGCVLLPRCSRGAPPLHDTVFNWKLLFGCVAMAHLFGSSFATVRRYVRSKNLNLTKNSRPSQYIATSRARSSLPGRNIACTCGLTPSQCRPSWRQWYWPIRLVAHLPLHHLDAIHDTATADHLPCAEVCLRHGTAQATSQSSVRGSV